MQKYVITDVKDNGLFACVTMQNNKCINNHIFTSGFANGMRTGDRVFALGKYDMPIVWTYRDRIKFAIEPISDYRIRNFVSDNMDLMDGIYFRYVLMRALARRGIMPSIFVSNNLRMFLWNKQR